MGDGPAQKTGRHWVPQGGSQAMRPREAGPLQHPPIMQRRLPEPQLLHLLNGELDACPASLRRVRNPQNKDLLPDGSQQNWSKPVFFPPGSGRRPFASSTYFILPRLWKGFVNLIFPLRSVGNRSAVRSARRGLPALSSSHGTHGLHVEPDVGPGRHSRAWLLCPGRSVPAGAQRARTRLG